MIEPKLIVGTVRSAWKDVREYRAAGFSWPDSIENTACELDEIARGLEELHNSPDGKERGSA